jgi:hypothetical protein
MDRSPSDVHRIILGFLLVGLATAASVADDREIAGVARTLRVAWETFEEYQEIATAHGARREIALMHLQLGYQKSDLLRVIEDMDSETRLWHPNRRQWNSIQHEFYGVLQYHRRNLTAVNEQLRNLDLEWKRLNEVARAQAQLKRKRPIPMDREGLLQEFLRLETQIVQAYSTAKLAVNLAARETEQPALDVFQKAVDKLREPYYSSADPQTLEPFVEDFRAYFRKGYSPVKEPTAAVKKPSAAVKPKPSPAATKPPPPAK